MWIQIIQLPTTIKLAITSCMDSLQPGSLRLPSGTMRHVHKTPPSFQYTLLLKEQESDPVSNEQGTGWSSEGKFEAELNWKAARGPGQYSAGTTKYLYRLPDIVLLWCISVTYKQDSQNQIQTKHGGSRHVIDKMKSVWQARHWALLWAWSQGQPAQ